MHQFDSPTTRANDVNTDPVIARVGKHPLWPGASRGGGRRCAPPGRREGATTMHSLISSCNMQCSSDWPRTRARVPVSPPAQASNAIAIAPRSAPTGPSGRPYPQARGHQSSTKLGFEAPAWPREAIGFEAPARPGEAIGFEAPARPAPETHASGNPNSAMNSAWSLSTCASRAISS